MFSENARDFLMHYQDCHQRIATWEIPEALTDLFCTWCKDAKEINQNE